MFMLLFIEFDMSTISQFFFCFKIQHRTRQVVMHFSHILTRAVFNGVTYGTNMSEFE